MSEPLNTNMTDAGTKTETPAFYCPRCQVQVNDPLACGDCAALICRQCGSPLENIDDLGIG